MHFRACLGKVAAMATLALQGANWLRHLVALSRSIWTPLDFCSPEVAPVASKHMAASPAHPTQGGTVELLRVWISLISFKPCGSLFCFQNFH